MATRISEVVPTGVNPPVFRRVTVDATPVEVAPDDPATQVINSALIHPLDSSVETRVALASADFAGGRYKTLSKASGLPLVVIENQEMDSFWLQVPTGGPITVEVTLDQRGRK